MKSFIFTNVNCRIMLFLLIRITLSLQEQRCSFFTKVRLLVLQTQVFA